MSSQLGLPATAHVQHPSNWSPVDTSAPFRARDLPMLLPKDAPDRKTNTHTAPKVDIAARTATSTKLAALVELGRELKRQGYAWVCPSLETQTLVNGRFTNRRALNLTDLFGWNREGTQENLARQLPARLIESLCDAGVLQITDGETVRSRVRFSSLADTLLAHSAWPAQESDAVLAGPEAQRFGAFITRELSGPCTRVPGPSRPFTLVDIGCGSGAAGILAARLLSSADGGPPSTHVLLTDRSPRALLFAEVNAKLANLPHFECRYSDALAAVPEPPMLVLANTQGWVDARRRCALHDGDELGTGQALRIVDQCMDRMPPGGTLLMCAVAPVVRGADVLWRNVEPRVMGMRRSRSASLRYEVLETDVFSHQLAHPDCAEVDRFALVGLTVQMQASN